ncbi:MAG TPA: DUF4402 domain-containing protein [Gemmatimonadales bacterium]|nr:DUF4402 domain-containing protein [Gemmatimonadales bacterium]
MRRALVSLLVAPLISQAAFAQGGNRPVSAVTRQNMAFGTVIPGVPVTVSWSDPLAAGQVEIRGNRNVQVSVQITLPAAMAGPFGATMPMLFGSADGGYSQTNNAAAATSFDPRSPLVATLSPQGRLFIFLGGTVSPPVTQRAGAYTGTITVTVAYL